MVTSPSRARVGWRNRVLLFACAAASVATFGSLTFPCLATPVSWLSDTDGLWTDAANWSSGPLLPGVADDVVIDRPAADPIITLSPGTQASINSLLCHETLKLNGLGGGGTLRVTGVSQFSRDVLLGGGKLQGGTWQAIGTAKLQVDGACTLDAVTLDANLSINPTGNVTVTNGLNLSNRTIRIYYGTRSDPLTMWLAQTISGTGSIVFESASSGAANLRNVETLTIGPSITISTGTGGGTVGSSSYPLVNQGLISARTLGQTLAVSGTPMTNQGTVEAMNGSTLALAGSWSNGGIIRLGEGSTLRLGGTFSIAGLGTFERTGGTVRLTGTLDNTGQTFGLDSAKGSWILDGGKISGGTIGPSTGGSQLLFGSSGTLYNVTLATDLTVPTGSSVTLDGNWTNTSTLRVDGGRLYLGGNFTTAGAGAIQLNGGVVGVSGTLDNTGQTFTASSAAGWWRLSGTIKGGVLAQPTGAAYWVPSGDYAKLDGVQIDADMTVSDLSAPTSTTLTLKNGCSSSRPVTFTLANYSYDTALTFTGDHALADGTQVVLEGPGGGTMMASLYVKGTAVPPGVTVRSGSVGGTVSTNANKGTISAQTPGKTVTVTGTGFSNQGTMQAINGGVLKLYLSDTWVSSGVIRADGTSTIELSGSVTPSKVPTLTREPGSTVNVTGTLKNSGASLALDAFGGGWNLAANGVVQNGSIVAGGGRTALTVLGGTVDGVTLDADVEVATGATLTLSGTWTNHGTIRSTGGTISFNTIPTNPGAFELHGATLRVSSTLTTAQVRRLPLAGNVLQVGTLGLLDNTGDALDLDGTAGLRLYGGSFKGGAITSSDGTQVVAPATLPYSTQIASTLSNTSLGAPMTILTNHRVSVSGVTLLNSRITLMQDPNWGSPLPPSPPELRFVTPTGLTGSGEIVFDGAVYGGSITTQSSSLTISPGIVVRTGTGSGDFSLITAALLNQGTISAQSAGRQIAINSSSSAQFTNDGLLEARNGGVFCAYNVDGAGATSANADSTINVFRVRQGTINVAGTLAVHRSGGSAGSNKATVLTVANNGADMGLRQYTGRFDVNDNDFILDYAPGPGSPLGSKLAEISDMLRSGRNSAASGLTWDGNGITSSTARDDTQKIATLGVLDNADPDGAGPLTSPFPTIYAALPVDDTCIIVKYTYYGDVTFDGTVDAADYALIDNAFNFQNDPVIGPSLRVWAGGDMNFDGAIDAADYALIDNAFNFQSGPLASAPGWATPTDAADTIAVPDASAPLPVPEPSACAVLALLAATALAHRPRRARPRHPAASH